MSELLKTILLFYGIGFVIVFLMGFEGISKHITWKGLVATFIMSLFSFFALWYMMLGGGNKNNYPY
jgi:hypothetical protein